MDRWMLCLLWAVVLLIGFAVVFPLFPARGSLGQIGSLPEASLFLAFLFVAAIVLSFRVLQSRLALYLIAAAALPLSIWAAWSLSMLLAISLVIVWQGSLRLARGAGAK
jgi:hypothetical protein